MAIEEPDMNAWLAQAKRKRAGTYRMFLIHNGIVRATPRHAVRAEAARPVEAPERDARVVAVDLSYDKAGLEAALKHLVGEGVYYVQAWLNEGRVEVGESLTYVRMELIFVHMLSLRSRSSSDTSSRSWWRNATHAMQSYTQCGNMQPCAGEVALQLAVSSTLTTSTEKNAHEKHSPR